MSTYDAVRGLPLHVEGYRLEPLEREVARGFTLKRTVVVLHGGGEEGRGEEVDYDPRTQETFQADEGKLPLPGEHTLESFSLLQSGQTEYRRWAFESAALDLALRQAGTTLADALGREVRPLRFVVSTRAKLDEWRELYPSIRFKLDPVPDWTDEEFARLGPWGNVDVLDLKGAYRGTSVDNPPDPVLYAKTVDAVPTAWIEDPALTPETEEVLRPHRDRITWDAPIHSWADVEALPFAPRCLNCKPSRFGALSRLFEFYDRCAEHDIALYGGGQFELGPGRSQIQLLAALFHPDGPNDVAPGAYNEGGPRPGLPTSPLTLQPDPGYRA